MIGFLVCIILAIHLLLVNLACGGPLLAFWWSRLESSSSDDKPVFPGRQLTSYSLWALVLGMVSGGLLLFSPRSADIWRAVERFPVSTYWFAGMELLFSVICLVVMILWWRGLSQRKWLLGLVALATSTNLLYHFPPLLFVINRLARNPSWSEHAVIERKQFVQLLQLPEIASLTTHFALASVAVGGIAGLWICARKFGEDFNQDAQWLGRRAGIVSLTATLLQIPVGIWVLTAIPGSERSVLMGGGMFASVMFLASLMTTMYLLQGLVKIALGEITNFDCYRVILLTCAVVFLMTATLYLVQTQG